MSQSFFGSRALLFCCFPLILLAGAPAQAGIVVTNGGKGIQFAEALSISVNGKDKVLRLGTDPKFSGPVGKLTSVKLDGAVFKDRDASALVLSGDGPLVYILPEGLPKGGPASISAAWAGAAISYKKSKSDKAGESIPFSSFVAFLPGGSSELVNVCENPQLLKLIGGVDRAFATQITLITAAASTYASDPALLHLQRFVEEAMRSRYEQFESGTATVDVLNQALRFAELSRSAYPKVPEQVKLRDQITGTKVWLDRRVATLRALAAGNEWDPYILGDRELERYSQVFPDLADLRVKALKASLESHKHSGEQYLAEHEFQAANREFRVAMLRQPSDKLLQQRVLMSWTDYSREVALDNQRNRKRLGTGEQEILNQAIQFAANYKAENKLELAYKSIQDAEAVDPDSLPMLLRKAEILGAQREFAKAFVTLDRYDLHAVEEERAKSSSLRNDLLFKQRSSLEDIKEQLQKVWSEGSYHKLHELALNGLRAKDDDADLLYQAGVSSFITRDARAGRDYLARYLDVTNTLDADPAQRARVRSLLAHAQLQNHTESGEPNWLSGKKLSADIYYCPVSLAFQPRIDRIDASNKMHVAYEWNGNELLSITPTFEKADRATGEKRISFVYNDSYPQVLFASDGETRNFRMPSPDPDERLKYSSLVLLNNPYIDPDTAEKLTGRNMAVGIAGNRFFDPFVWDKIHYFRFQYDSSGRVAHARELSDRNGTPTDLSLDFEWSGQQLIGVRAYQGLDDRRRTRIYERTMQYEDGHLVAEDVQGTGKPSHIKYNYNGGHLVSANTTNDPNLDDRSRQVTFR